MKFATAPFGDCDRIAEIAMLLEIDAHDFEGPARVDRLFTGIALERPTDVDPVDLVVLTAARHTTKATGVCSTGCLKTRERGGAPGATS